MCTHVIAKPHKKKHAAKVSLRAHVGAIVCLCVCGCVFFMAVLFALFFPICPPLAECQAANALVAVVDPEALNDPERGGVCSAVITERIFRLERLFGPAAV